MTGKMKTLRNQFTRKLIIPIALLWLLVSGIFIFASGSPTANEENGENHFNVPSFVFKGKILELKKIGTFDKISLNGIEITTDKLEFQTTGEMELKIIKDGKEYTFSIYSINGILTILPPLVAILLALLFKDVVVALFVGIFTGALFLNRFDFIGSFFHVVDKYILEALIDSDRASIILFTLMLGGMVGVISKSGGVKGIVDTLSRKVKSTTGTQFYTWLMGILIFFDDYTNTLVVGNTMRPLTDKWKISRYCRTCVLSCPHLHLDRF
jgi:hypothetical protein